MPQWILERRLTDVSGRLKRLRKDFTVAEEQIAHLADEAEDARLRALVSETPLADVEAREAMRHVDALKRHRDELAERIARLEAEQDSLLDRMASNL